MNLQKRLRHLAEISGKDRMTGRSTLIARAAKELDALVITANFAQAKHLMHSHGVVAKSMEMNLEGFMGPFLFDHHAVETLLTRAANKIEDLEQQLEAAVKEHEKSMATLQKVREALK